MLPQYSTRQRSFQGHISHGVVRPSRVVSPSLGCRMVKEGVQPVCNYSRRPGSWHLGNLSDTCAVSPGLESGVFPPLEWISDQGQGLERGCVRVKEQIFYFASYWKITRNKHDKFSPVLFPHMSTRNSEWAHPIYLRMGGYFLSKIHREDKLILW